MNWFKKRNLKAGSVMMTQHLMLFKNELDPLEAREVKNAFEELINEGYLQESNGLPAMLKKQILKKKCL